MRGEIKSECSWIPGFFWGFYIHSDSGQGWKHRDHLGNCFRQPDKADDGLAQSGSSSGGLRVVLRISFGIRLRRFVGELDTER